MTTLYSQKWRTTHPGKRSSIHPSGWGKIVGGEIYLEFQIYRRWHAKKQKLGYLVEWVENINARQIKMC